MEIGTFYINGEFVTPKGTEKIALINPATEEEIGFVVAGNEEDVDLAVEAANKAFFKVSSLTLEERKTILTDTSNLPNKIINMRLRQRKSPFHHYLLMVCN